MQQCLLVRVLENELSVFHLCNTRRFRWVQSPGWTEGPVCRLVSPRRPGRAAARGVFAGQAGTGLLLHTLAGELSVRGLSVSDQRARGVSAADRADTPHGRQLRDEISVAIPFVAAEE